MAPIDFTDNENAVIRLVLGYIFKWKGTWGQNFTTAFTAYFY